jgi:cytosine/adenosine deaminase-related metal-dependent hydrolase
MIDMPEKGPRSRRLGASRELVKRGFPFEQSLNLDEQRISALWGLTQLIRHGSTTIFDPGGSGPIWWLGNPWSDEELLVKEAGRIGARVYAATAFRSRMIYRDIDGTPHYYDDLEGGWHLFNRAVEFAEEFNGAHNDRIRTALSPHAVDNTHPEILQATKCTADERGWLVQVHAAQFDWELKLVREKHGCTSVELLEQLGFLGANVILGHCIYIDRHSKSQSGDNDLDRLASSGTAVVHSPLPFARGGNVLQDISEYLDRGVTVSIGTDIWPADIIRELNLAWMAGKIAAGRADRPTAWEIYDAATLGGAQALGRQDLGRLEEGAKADIIVIDMSAAEYGPITDPVRSLITAGMGRDVKEVFIDGQHVLVDGTFPGLDRTTLLEQAKGVFRTWCRVASQRDPRKLDVLELLIEPHRGLGPYNPG